MIYFVGSVHVHVVVVHHFLSVFVATIVYFAVLASGQFYATQMVATATAKADAIDHVEMDMLPPAFVGSPEMPHLQPAVAASSCH